MSKTRLLETIKCLDGLVYNLSYHQNRVDASRAILGHTDKMTLSLTPPKHGLYRCRIVYEKEIETLEYIPYQIKELKSFKLIESAIEYSLKYEDRDGINSLLEQREGCDEIIIVKDGLITDTSIANLCFFDGKSWLTPKTPLLEGTTRRRYLDQGKIITADIYARDIAKYSKIATMNAMVDFNVIEDAIIR